MIPKIVIVNGLFNDQKGLIKRGEITGYNGNGVPCRKWTWIDPLLPELKDKSFEAFDDQIINNMTRDRK